MNVMRTASDWMNSSSGQLGSQQASKARDNESVLTRTAMPEGQSESEQEQFEALLNDLKHAHPELNESAEEAESIALSESVLINGTSLLEEASTPGKVSANLQSGEPFDVESLSALDEGFDGDSLPGDDETSEGGVALEFSLFMEARPNAAVEARSDAVGVSQGSQVVNEAVNSIIEEMRFRARRNTSQRWQFTLPGLLGGQVSVTLERMADQSWRVELSTPEDCADEDRLALMQRLGGCLSDATVITAES